MKSSSLIAIALILPGFLFAAEAPFVVPLWANGAPGSEGKTAPEKTEPPTANRDYIRVTSVHNPSLTLYLPPKERATGAAVIICPGGAHQFLAMDIEGDHVGRWLRERGIAGCVLKYRLARETNSTYRVEVESLADAQRAIRLVRTQSQEWNINPARVGVMGFSAGGQVAALASTRYDSGNAEAADPIDRVSCKPDFQALIYPAIPREMNVTNAPPAFLACGANDRPNFSEGLANLYLSLKRAGVSAELHVYAGIGHGFGVRPTAKGPIAGWPVRFEEWLGHLGFLKKD